MAGNASYKTKIYASGTPTTMTDEPLNNVSGNIWIITDTTKRVIDYNTDITLTVDGAVETEYVINYLEGIITLDTTATTVVITGKYLPLNSIAGANSYTLNLTSNILENTDYDNESYRTRTYGLYNASLSISRYFINNFFKDAIKNRDNLIAVVKIIDNLDIKLNVVLSEANSSGDVDSLESEDLTFELNNKNSTNISY